MVTATFADSMADITSPFMAMSSGRHKLNKVGSAVSAADSKHFAEEVRQQIASYGIKVDLFATINKPKLLGFSVEGCPRLTPAQENQMINLFAQMFEVETSCTSIVRASNQTFNYRFLSSN